MSALPEHSRTPLVQRFIDDCESVRCLQSPQADQAREVLAYINELEAQNQWQPIADAKAGKNYLLRFDNLIETRWVGCLDCWGVCQWPPMVAGKKPDAFCELAAPPVAANDNANPTKEAV
jgi:hypothetical protein